MTRPIFTIIDEEYLMPNDFLSRFFAGLPVEVPATKVRIRFNRPLTWSEREHFRLFVNNNPVQKHHFNHEDPSELFITTSLGSREVVQRVQKFVAEEFLNIHPKAVKTITPKVEV